MSYDLEMVDDYVEKVLIQNKIEFCYTICFLMCVKTKSNNK